MNHEQFVATLRPGSRVLLAALVPAKGDEDRPFLTALAKAVEAAGATVVGTLVQRRGVSRARAPGGAQKFHTPLSAATFIGEGKVAELAELVGNTQAEAIAFCNPLSGTQQRNLEQATGVTVLWYRPEAEASP